MNFDQTGPFPSQPTLAGLGAPWLQLRTPHHQLKNKTVLSLRSATKKAVSNLMNPRTHLGKVGKVIESGTLEMFSLEVVVLAYCMLHLWRYQDLVCSQRIRKKVVKNILHRQLQHIQTTPFLVVTDFWSLWQLGGEHIISGLARSAPLFWRVFGCANTCGTTTNRKTWTTNDKGCCCGF